MPTSDLYNCFDLSISYDSFRRYIRKQGLFLIRDHAKSCQLIKICHTIKNILFRISKMERHLPFIHFNI